MMPVYDKVKKQVHTVVWSDKVSNQVDSKVWNKVMTQVYEPTWSRSRDQIVNQVRDKVR